MPSKQSEYPAAAAVAEPSFLKPLGHRKAEDDLVQLNKLALRGRMAACISHELNNQLTIGYGNLEMACSYLRTNQTALALDHLDCATRVLGQMFGMTQSLYSGLSTEPEFHAVSLNSLLDELVQNARPLLKKHRANLELELAEPLPAIWADAGQIGQVVLNMIHNAVQSTLGVTIRLCTSYDAKSRMVKCTVQDNGPGISSEKLRKLFVFLKTDKTGGHGLGLFVCKEIITRHEGTISVASLLGKGTTFTISLLPASAGSNRQQC
jgi:signal transduction histidine kinase